MPQRRREPPALPQWIRQSGAGTETIRNALETQHLSTLFRIPFTSADLYNKHPMYLKTAFPIFFILKCKYGSNFYHIGGGHSKGWE